MRDVLCLDLSSSPCSPIFCLQISAKVITRTARQRILAWPLPMSCSPSTDICCIRDVWSYIVVYFLKYPFIDLLSINLSNPFLNLLILCLHNLPGVQIPEVQYLSILSSAINKSISLVKCPQLLCWGIC